MISFDEAMSVIGSLPKAERIKKIPTRDALYRILAQDILAPISLPPFDNSAVDGFAVSSQWLQNARSNNPVSFLVAHTLSAQGQAPYELSEHAAARIMTGAPMPLGADAVVMQEHGAWEEDRIYFKASVSEKENVRFRGEDIAQGMLVAQKYAKVTSRLIGLLYGLGISEISVFDMPRIAVVSTGNELVEAPMPLRHGEVYALTAHMLKAQCEAEGITEVHSFHAKDTLEDTLKTLETALQFDVVLCSGGISVGAYDYVGRALETLGVETIFHQGRWRPGKPLFLGKQQACTVFGLPGNPVASFVGFLVFVRSYLAQVYRSIQLPVLNQGYLVNGYEKKPDITFFARAHREGEALTIVPGQGSHQLFDLCRANALCLLKEGAGRFPEKHVVDYFDL